MNEDVNRKLWKVGLTKRAAKGRASMPPLQQAHFDILADDLQKSGPVQGGWPNYSKLGPSLHHCHLSPKWVACWEVLDNKIHIIEVYYIGSRKDAPY